MLEEKTGFGSIKVPFSTFDIFGYLIPGFTILICIFLFEFISLKRLNASFYTPFYSLLEIIYNSNLLSNWVFSILYLFFFLTFAYVTGHIISSFSSFFIDRILIFKGYGYPYEKLLKLPNAKKSEFSAPFYRGLFFWTNIYFLLRCFSSFISPPQFMATLLNLLGWFIIVMLIIKIAASSIKHAKRGYLFRIFTQGNLNHITEIVRFFVIKIFPIFFDLLSSLIAGFLKTRESFDEDFINKYKLYFIKNYSMNPTESKSNNYWLSYCYVADRSNLVFNTFLVNWLQMFSFARNLSMSFYLAFLYSFVSLFVQASKTPVRFDSVLKFIPFTFFVLFFIMLVRYYYLYYSYFSKFIFRSFVYLNIKNSEGQQKIDQNPKDHTRENGGLELG